MNLKKILAYLISTLLLIGFTTSCSSDEEEDVVAAPTVADNGSSKEVTVGDKITLKALIVAKAKLSKVEVRLNNATLTTKTSFVNPDSDNFSFEYTTKNEDAGKTLVFTIVATDRKNQTGQKDFSVVVKARTTPLSNEESFTWERTGSAAGTGLSTFGLAWTSNTSTSAIIRKDTAKKLVKLSAAQYTSITTKEALKAAVDAATGVEDIRDVSVTAANQNYPDLVIATITNADVYYIIRIENSRVESTPTAGTKVTITGKFKR